MSTDRIARFGGFVNPKLLPKGPNGRNLCRWCKVVEVAPPARTFCSRACVDEHKVRTQPDFAKSLVYERDHGICALCRLDTCADLKGPVGYGHDRRFPMARAKSRWDMDHVVPVVEGGGACGLENLRTLCKPCHRAETAKLARRRAEARKQARGTIFK